MKISDNKMTIYLIQHSHTDIGYTESQQQITSYHASYIRSVIDAINNKKNVKWVCEGLWSVEQFLDSATESEKASFIKCINNNKIGLSGSWLNMTEAVSDDVMKAVLSAAHKKVNELGFFPHCAMTADVNGYSAGYPALMNSVGVDCLLTLINETHGKIPFEHRQTPFVWKGPNNSELLCWVGEHYNKGNWVGLTIPRGTTVEESLVSAEKLLPEYIKELKERDYPFDFVPLTVSGIFTDNAPPCFEIGELVSLWNQKHKDTIEIRFCLLEEFFEKLKTVKEQLPVYRGDWTDWWADGIGSTPRELRLFRQAQRNCLITNLLDDDNEIVSEQAKQEAAKAVAMYAEHTWGYHSSVLRPWEYNVMKIELHKTQHAILADKLSEQNLDKVKRFYGKAEKCYAPWNRFRVVNPYDERCNAVVGFDVPFKQDVKIPASLTDKNILYPVQFSKEKLWTSVKLNPKEVCTLEFCHETVETKDVSFDGETIITPFYRIVLDKDEGGAVSVYDIGENKELVTEDYAAFKPIYEVTYAENGDVYNLRSSFKCSRSIEKTQRYFGKIKNITFTEDGPLFARICLDYELKGFGMLMVEYTLFKTVKRFDVNVICNKESVWEPENVYLTLPFASKNRTVKIDKSGTWIRPGVDGIPGCCSGFYSALSGIMWNDEDFGIAVAMQDSALLRMGALDITSPAVCSQNEQDNHRPVFAWLMNNFWETNFKASLGGFHEFGFSITSHKDMNNPSTAEQKIKQLSLGVLPISLDK